MNKKISTVLAIDDNAENIKVLGNILKRNGINVLVSLSGANGIEMVKLKKPDLILLDIQMPEMDGFEVCTILKSNPDTSNIPIIFLTARNDDETIEKVYSLGASDYTQKPFSEIELLSRINFHIKLSYAEKRVKEALKEAKEANQAKSDFLSNMSHEMRTPLNSIIGYSELLAEDEYDTGKSKKLSTIISSGKHLLALINGLLDFSKIEAGKVEINETQISIKDILKKIQAMFLVLQKKTGLDLQILISSAVPEKIISDEQKIEQIIINLVNNAFKFTEKGSILIQCTYIQNEIIIKVSDTGIGIKDENKNKIFSMFEQTESEISIKYGGTGLGLALSKKLAKLIKGDLTFTSQYGKGSEFTLNFKADAFDDKNINKNFDYSFVDAWITSDLEISDLIINAIEKIPEIFMELKLAVETNELERINFSAHKTKGFFGNFHMKELYEISDKLYSETIVKVPDIEEIKKLLLEMESIIEKIPEKYLKKNYISRIEDTSINKKISVIVADDVEDNRNLIDLILKKINIDVDFAENGKELLEKIAIKHYDLILLDIHMPVMDGKEALKIIRKNKKFDNIEIYVLTAQAGDEDREFMLNSGCNGYITKPIDKNILRNTIKVFIEK